MLRKAKRPKLRHAKSVLCWLVLFVCFPSAACPQGSDVSTTQATAHRLAAPAEYTLGAGDVVTISIADAPEFSGKFRVSDAGLLDVPGAGASIRAEGLTPRSLADAICKALIDAKQLRDPKVNVFVEEFHGRTISVLGAVAKPAVYPLERHTLLLEALSMAGGALPNAGRTVTIVRGAQSAEATESKAGSVQIIDVARLTSGEDPSANVEVRNGDVISVSAAQLVYVVGAVVKPGGYPMPSPGEGVTVMQALAMAEGLRSVASRSNAVIVRQSSSEKSRAEIPVDVGRVFARQASDPVLAPNDILYIPESGARKTLKVMGDVAMSAVNGLAIYGLGYRIGTRP